MAIPTLSQDLYWVLRRYLMTKVKALLLNYRRKETILCVQTGGGLLWSQCQVKCFVKSYRCEWRRPSAPYYTEERTSWFQICRVGCIDHIFTLRNILEESIEWNRNIHLNFIDFEKAFDTIHKNTLWKLLLSYGCPEKFVSIIKLFYKNVCCSVYITTRPLTGLQSPVALGKAAFCLLFFI